MSVTLIEGDCLEALRLMQAASVDAVVTDPPAGIGFMGKEWDSFGGPAAVQVNRSTYHNDSTFFNRTGSSPNGPSDRAAFIAFLSSVLAECLRVAKPGARLLCWAIPRTSHWTGTAIEDAGWIVEDVVTHLFGQGFPKAPSKLKPSAEFWWLARKASPRVPALNIDAGRIAGAAGCGIWGNHGQNPANHRAEPGSNGTTMGEGWNRPGSERNPAGRWPPNVALSHIGPEPCEACDGSGALTWEAWIERTRNYGGTREEWERVRGACPACDGRGEVGGCEELGTRRVAADGHYPAQRGESGYTGGWNGQTGLTEVSAKEETVAAWRCAEGCPVAMLDAQAGERTSGKAAANGHRRTPVGKDGRWFGFQSNEEAGDLYGDTGSASRFFYTSKASKSERAGGLEGLAASHPTVKPTALMRWLISLIAKPGDLILDPFAGSGSTMVAAVAEECHGIAIERDAEYMEICRRRVARAEAQQRLDLEVV